MSFMLSYHDIDIYDRDLSLLDDYQWLNDSILSYCLKRIEIQTNDLLSVYSSDCDRILTLHASTVSFLQIQCESEEDYQVRFI